MFQLNSPGGAEDWRSDCSTRKRVYRVLEAVFERSAASLLTSDVLASLLSRGASETDLNAECSSPSAERVCLFVFHCCLSLETRQSARKYVPTRSRFLFSYSHFQMYKLYINVQWRVDINADCILLSYLMINNVNNNSKYRE